MQRDMENELLIFKNSNKNIVQSLFHSEGYFWLVTAAATSFAVEELLKCAPEVATGKNTAQESQQVLLLFNQCIREHQITTDEIAQAQQWSLDNVAIINTFNNQLVVFRPTQCVTLSQCFTTYWLFFKLIELEWQEVMECQEMAETYQFMDTVIADSEELEAIAALLEAQEELDDDYKIYLRNHWQRTSHFWRNLQMDLTLLAQGVVPYQPLRD